VRRPLAVGSAVLVCLLALAGCTAERPEQQAAREQVEIHIAGRDGYDGTVHCTRNPRPWFVEQEATVFICTARRDDGECDWYRVDVSSGRVRVALDRVRGGCVLPL
jgi:hypothetical protein